MPVKVGEKLEEAIDEDLKTAGPNCDIELWQPERKDHREIPDHSRGNETGIGALSWEYPDRSGLPGHGSGPVGKSGVGALIHALGAGRGDAFPASIGR